MQLNISIKDKNNNSLVISDGLYVNGILVSGTSSLFSVSLPNFSAADILVTQSNYYSYNLSVSNVYDTEKTLNIVLVEIVTDINDEEFNKPYPSFSYFKSPCGMRVDFYNTSSYTGLIEWYINNQLLTTNNSGFIEVCNEQDIQLKQRVTTYRTLNSNTYCPVTEIVWDRQFATILTGNTVAGVIEPLEVYLEQDTNSNITIEDVRPQIEVELSSPKDQLKSSCCYTKGELLTITPSISIKNYTTVDYTITYKVMGPKGEINLPLPTVTIADDLVRSFRLDELGSYKITITITNLICGTEFYKELLVETCNFFTISYKGCSNYEFKNNSSSRVVSVTIDDVLNNTLLDSFQLSPGYTLASSFSDVSLYFITINYEVDGKSIQEVYVLNNYCVVEECLTTYLEDLLCSPTIKCKDCPDPIELNRFLLLLFTYSMKLNAEYGTNNYYTLLTESKFEELLSIQSVMDKIKEYCSRINCSSNLTKGFTYDCFENPYNIASTTSTGCKTCGK